MTDFQVHTRFAVRSDQGLVCKNTGNDWKTKLPGYSFTAVSAHAKLYAQLAGARRCANIVGGEVVPVRLELSVASVR